MNRSSTFLLQENPLSRLGRRRQLALILPPLLTVTMVLAFKGFVAWLGHPLGYLVAFLVYWIGWCLIVPVLILGGLSPLINLFREGRPRFGKPAWKGLLLLLWPLPFPIIFIFLPRLSGLNFSIIGVSFLLGLVIGVTEEILWRGVYVRLFPHNVWLNTIYPSIMFALWHVAPQSVLPSTVPGGAVAFVLYALVLGLSYAYYARKTGSIRWCTISHCLHDAFGLGALVYAAWLI